MADANPYADFEYLRTAPPPPVSDDEPPVGSASAQGRPRVYITKSDKPDANANPYARFDTLRGDGPRPDKSPTMASIALQVPTGFNEVAADTLGAPVDATTWLLNRIPGVKIDKPFLGSQSIKDAMGVIGANPDNAPARKRCRADRPRYRRRHCRHDRAGSRARHAGQRRRACPGSG